MTTNRNELQSMWLGETGSPKSYYNSSHPYPDQLGCLYRDSSNRWWQLVYLSSGSTPLSAKDGYLAFWRNKDNFTVSTKLADSARNRVAGVFLLDSTVTVAEGCYCFILKEGKHTNVYCSDGTAALGDPAYPSATTSGDMTFISAAAAQIAVRPVGIMLSACASNKGAIDLQMRNI
jgi:hypothetical protein